MARKVKRPIVLPLAKRELFTMADRERLDNLDDARSVAETVASVVIEAGGTTSAAMVASGLTRGGVNMARKRGGWTANPLMKANLAARVAELARLDRPGQAHPASIPATGPIDTPSDTPPVSPQPFPPRNSASGNWPYSAVGGGGVSTLACSSPMGLETDLSQTGGVSKNDGSPPSGGVGPLSEVSVGVHSIRTRDDPETGPILASTGGKNGSHPSGNGVIGGQISAVSANFEQGEKAQETAEFSEAIEAIGEVLEQFGPEQARHGEILEPERVGVEVLARLQASVVLRHKGLYGKHYAMIERLNGMLGDYLDGTMPEGQRKLFMAGGATVAGYVGALTAALGRLIPLERRSWGLPNDAGASREGDGRGSSTVFNIVIGTDQGYREHQRRRLAERALRDEKQRAEDLS